MSALPKLQDSFQAYLLGQGGDIAASVRDGDKADRHRLLSVYRHGYLSRLQECLGNDFAGLRAMLGEAAFDELTAAYVAAHPSRHANVRWLGRDMAEFIRRHPATKDRLDLAEMAQFEWALGLALDAADDDAMVADELMGLTGDEWGTLTVRPRANVQRLTLRTMAPKAWLRHETVTPGGLTVDPAERPVDWLVWRKEIDPQFRSMELDEAWAFDAAAAGTGFAALCEGIARFMPADQAAARAAGLLRVWIDARLLLPRQP
jgi:hypothetical protein